jgi:anti-sigma factor RsiW
MKRFEEKWTAWLDGQLSGKELNDFEASLPDLAAAESEKRDALKLGAFLKEQLAAQALTNEEFFSHQLHERIARDTQDRPAFAWLRRGKHRSTSTWWTVPRLVWSGATALALFVITTVVLMSQHPAGEQSEYLTQILNSRVDPAANPNATIYIFESKNDNKVTVLWTEGLQTLPAGYAAK